MIGSSLQHWSLRERITVFTGLGIRFFDPVLGEPVRDHLKVVAFPPDQRRPRRDAFRTSSGIYAFQGLPDLHDVEYPDEPPDAAIGSPPIQAEFVIEVQDQSRRFLPLSFHVTAPVQGIFPAGLSDTVSPPAAGPPGVYLFSGPTRYVSPGLAAVRAQFIDSTTGGPAAHAVLTVQLGSATWTGIADDRGSVLVLFAYPRASFSLTTSPPELATPLGQQQWQLTMGVQYEPQAVQFSTATRLPDLLSVFDQQVGVFRPSALGSAETEFSATLHFGQPLVLRSQGQSELLIESGASPP